MGIGLILTELPVKRRPGQFPRLQVHCEGDIDKQQLFPRFGKQGNTSPRAASKAIFLQPPVVPLRGLANPKKRQTRFRA
jgi:hypothetical protein